MRFITTDEVKRSRTTQSEERIAAGEVRNRVVRIAIIIIEFADLQYGIRRSIVHEMEVVVNDKPRPAGKLVVAFRRV